MSIPVKGMFGPLVFMCTSAVVQTFRNVAVQRGYRYAEHSVIGAKPVLEAIGPGLISTSFEISFWDQYNSPPAVWLPIVNMMVDSGEAWDLLLGPDYFGEYVLESVDETRQHFNGIGTPIVADLTLHVKEAQSFDLLGAIKNAVSGFI